MNIIIAGDGEVGLHLAQELSFENQNITIVDPHEDLLKMVESHNDVMAITGDSTSVEVLKSANVKKADLLISVLHDEKINIITAALGKQLGAKKNHCQDKQPGVSAS
jgi:trk system potassium uptake protein TrkA